MENAVNQVETKDKVETVAAAERAVILDGSCPTCRSGLDPTIGTGDYQEALRDAL